MYNTFTNVLQSTSWYAPLDHCMVHLMITGDIVLFHHSSGHAQATVSHNTLIDVSDIKQCINKVSSVVKQHCTFIIQDMHSENINYGC